MNSLEKVINLLKKTGDKAIVVNEKGDPMYVLMSFSAYEKLNLANSGVEGLTDEELLAKINREIEIWKDSQEIIQLPVDQYDFSQDLGDFRGFSADLSGENEGTDEDRYYFEPVE